MSANVLPSANDTVAQHRIGGTCLYLLGTFDRSVTVLSQQNRALNLAWALIDAHVLRTRRPRLNVAVIGAGFAGLTFAAALLRKEVPASIALFEERDTLLPLQQGSDTRWLHPNIYNWPAAGSNAAVAMLPVLNWTAGRASDVVVQVLDDWRELIEEIKEPTRPRLYCNTRHLQIAPAEDGRTARIEWIGERRECKDGTALTGAMSIGSSEVFDLVVLAIGFGAEKDNQLSYWRNETFAQPSLSQPRRTFLISGQGDGALIDLLRVRVSQYRQDRILSELFSGKSSLIKRLKVLREERYSDDRESLFHQFERLRSGTDLAAEQLKTAESRLAHRLRRDTDALLRLQVRNLEDLFSAGTSRTSFQNALLVYLLYRCGGFAPSNESEVVLKERYGIAEANVIHRHGTARGRQLKRLIPTDLYLRLRPIIKDAMTKQLRQTGERVWPGGYLGFRGPTSRMLTFGDKVRRTWRKEYLPAPTILLGETICGTVAGFISRIRPSVEHFRVTLHRTLPLHGDELLQQTCDYRGRGLVDAENTAARIFEVTSGTIGLAYRARRITRSRKGVSAAALTRAMERLELQNAARKMMPGVRFLLAIPLLQPETRFVGPSPVAAMLYLDSRDKGFWLDDNEVQSIVAILQDGASATWENLDRWPGRLSNVHLAEVMEVAPKPARMPSGVGRQLEFVSIAPPISVSAHSLNFDYSDATPIVEVD